MGAETRRLWLATALLVLVGLALNILLLMRQWPEQDQFSLLKIGADFSEHGTLHPTAKRMSGEGRIPGCLLQLLIGVPLRIWPDFRSPALLVSLFHLGAGILMGGLAYRAGGPRFTLLLLGIYWLSPNRLFHGSILWEPSYLYLFSALHAVVCFCSRQTKNAAASFALGLLHALTFQIHGSFLALALLTALLFGFRRIRLHVLPLLLGGGLGGVTLLPMLLAWWHGEHLGVAPSQSHIGLGLLHVYPLFKTVLVWAQLGSLCPDMQFFRENYFLDTAWLMASPAHIAGAVAAGGIMLAGYLSYAFPLAAGWEALKDRRRVLASDPAGPLLWLESYGLLAFCAAFIATALSPAILQNWHLAILLHAACLQCAVWIYRQWPDRGPVFKISVYAFVLLRVAAVLFIALVHPFFVPAPISLPVIEGTSPSIAHLLPAAPSP